MMQGNEHAAFVRNGDFESPGCPSRMTERRIYAQVILRANPRIDGNAGFISRSVVKIDFPVAPPDSVFLKDPVFARSGRIRIGQPSAPLLFFPDVVICNAGNRLITGVNLGARYFFRKFIRSAEIVRKLTTDTFPLRKTMDPFDFRLNLPSAAEILE